MSGSTDNGVWAQWQRLPIVQRILIGGTLGLVLLVAIAGIIGVLAPSLFTGDTETPKLGTQGENTDAPAQDEPAVEHVEGSGSYVTFRDSYIVDQVHDLAISKEGVAQMPITTDPREAAAAAAAIAFTIDPGTYPLSRSEFAAGVFDTWLHPSPEYVGPGEEIEASAKRVRYGKQSTIVRGTDPMLALDAQLNACAQDMEQCRWWWTIMVGDQYQSMAPNKQSITSTPLIVMSETEMTDYWGAANAADAFTWSKWFGEPVDRTPDTPGATLTNWYVLNQIHNSFPPENDTFRATWEQGVKISIWCDAPESGGLCGVADATWDVSGPQHRGQDVPETWPER